jgi:hypothetical protein
MAEVAEYTIGSDVDCIDGPGGVLKRIVVDPVARTLTHLVVEPWHGADVARLVPIALVDSTGSGIRLRCTVAALVALEPAEETQFLPGASGQWPYGQDQMFSWPYYGLELESARMASLQGLGRSRPVATYDRVPAGEVEVRRGDTVHALDGDIGQVQGLVVDRTDHQVTHVLLAQGHRWGQKTVVVPIKAVLDIRDGVRIDLTKNQVRDLPSLALDYNG